MKRIISLILVLVLAMGVLVACQPADDAPETPDTPGTSDTDTPDTDAPADAEGKITKLGLGQNISIGSSREAGEDVTAQSQADVTMAAVGFDEDGKVVSVTIDVVQAKVAFDEELEVASDIEEEVKSKKVLKDDYGMKAVSEKTGIGKEWYEQMEAFEEWMIGKTAAEITGLKVKEANPTHQHVPDVPELTSSVTITVENYIAAVGEAWDNAVDVVGGEKVGLGVNAGIGSANGLGEKEDGSPLLPSTQANVYMSALAFDSEGTVVGSIIDTAQVKVNFDEEGKITSDLNEELRTKHELKDDYGMKTVSEKTGIGKEWYEQMEAFQEWMIGKSVSEITGLKVKEANPTHQHVPDVPELTSTVTITVEGYLDVVQRAFDIAR